ncbi:F-box only protein 28, partial [Penaeus vannamei]
TCKRFEQIGSNILNAAFQRLQHLMSQRFQAIKGQMPRRESARRKHPLVREHDIVETLHMRLMLLQMSFGKHIERKHCCFFAGDILDEVHRILWYIKNTPTLGRAYKVTDELFDLSSMAMEYFKEHIEPRLPEITCFGSDFLDITTRYSDGCSVRPSGGSARVSEPEDDIPEFDTLPPSNMVLRKRIRRIRQGMRRYNTQLVALKRELKSCKSKLTDQHKQMMEYATRMDEYDKKFEESSRKFSTVLQELNKCKTELQYWRSKSPAHPLLCYGCGQAVGEGANQQLQAGVLMQGGDETVVFVPLAKASSQEGGESATPSAVFGRGSGRSGLCAMNGSVRNLERVFDLELSPSETSAVEPASHSKVVPETLPLAGVPLALSSVSPTSVSSPPIAPSHTHSAPPGTLPHVHSQPYSAFHTCGASHQTEQHRWDSSQECAEDLSMSRPFKHDLYDDGECGTLKRRVSDEESDNCDTSDDTVGRRVKERKRIKLDVL